MNVFWDVFNGIGLTWAIGSGILAGSTFVLWASLQLKLAHSTPRMVFAVVVTGLILGTIFFAGQISQAYFTDPNWPRALARYALWDVFSVAVGLGLGFARRFAKKKKKEA